MSKAAVYLEQGKTYLVLELDEAIREIGRQIVVRSDLPSSVAEKCDRYKPHDFREVRVS